MHSSDLRKDREEAAAKPLPPAELVQFMKGTEPRSLLITGAPGAGKTTLSLSLLAALDRPSFFVATRVGRGNLLHHFPWLVGTLPPDRLVDLEDVRPEAERQEDLMHQLDRLVSTVDPLSAGRRLRDFLNLPEPLARSLGEPPARAGHQILYLDSWDGLVEPYVHLLGLDELGRSTLEHGLLSLFQLAGWGLVLCSEGTAPQSLEYLVDGVVELRSETDEGHVARYMHIRKLRGQSLTAATHAFTLHQGKYTDCPKVSPSRLDRHDILSGISLDSGPGRPLRFGIPFLDGLLGPLGPGASLLAELDARGTSAPLGLLLLPFWMGAARSGWKVVMLTDLAHDPRYIAPRLSEGAAPEGSRDTWRFLPSSSKVLGEDLWKELLDAIQPKTAVDVSVRTLSSLLRITGEELVSRLGQVQLKAREEGAVVVFVAGSNDPFLPSLSTMVPTHVGVRQYHGTYLLSGRSPPTANVVVVAEPRAGDGFSVRYLPMV